MKVILNEDIRKVGLKDDVITVKNGFGRNFLIPQGKAKLATPSAIKMLEENIKQAAFKQDKIKQEAADLATKMADLKLQIGAKAGSNGKIFGSVTTIQVAQALKDKGFDVDRRRIVLSDDIKILGDFKATANLHKEVQVDFDIEVVQE